MLYFLGKILDIDKLSLDNLNNIKELKLLIKKKVKILENISNNNLKFYIPKEKEYIYELYKLKNNFSKEINIVYSVIVCNCH